MLMDVGRESRIGGRWSGRPRHRYRKPTKESLTTPEYKEAMIARHTAEQELDTISIHRGVDDIERPALASSMSSNISRFLYRLQILMCLRLFSRSKMEIEGQLLCPEDGDDIDVIVDFPFKNGISGSSDKEVLLFYNTDFRCILLVISLYIYENSRLQ
ncbi:hypothetical protein AAG570_004215 [Ranatra chinensis]|uniref:Uncharacterized protein n=1 Tax=Ranatra chinensis TaxID=642074 RepID=A0ABD0Y347_9HEMI